MRATLLALVLALHPRGFRELVAADIEDHFDSLAADGQRRMVLDLTRNLPGVHLDQLRLRRIARGRRPRPEASMLDLLTRYLRFATRRLLQTPLITGAAALTLAIGIGSTAAIFSLINGVFLNPLSAPDPKSLIDVYELSKEGRTLPMSYETYLDYRDGAESFEHLGVMRAQSVSVTGGGGAPERIRGLFVTAPFFGALGE
ncbi:MAG: hypothetical protein AAFX50_25055, partial [Acidobacteriota bacterium]